MGHRPILHACYKTVGNMLREEIRIYSKCDKRGCEQRFRVNLRMIAKLHGEEFSMIGWHPRCPALDCEGRLNFIVGFNGNYPMMPLNRWEEGR